MYKPGVLSVLVDVFVGTEIHEQRRDDIIKNVAFDMENFFGKSMIATSDGAQKSI